MSVLNSENRPTVLFVCHGSSQLGLGHVMRARTVAQAMTKYIHVHVMAFGDPEILTALLRGRDYTYEIACHDEDIIHKRQSMNVHVVVFDMTTADVNVVKSLRPLATLISLSPVFNCLDLMHVVYHRTTKLTNELADAMQVAEVRAALDYVVLRETCQRIPENVYIKNLHRNPLAVAISMGGGDASNHTLALLTEISKIQIPLLIWVLLGEGYSHSYHALVDCVKQSVQHEIILAKTTDSLWRVLETCSVGIFAGGITTYEAAYAGLPSLNVMYSHRAPILVGELVECGIAAIAGPPVSEAIAVIGKELLCLANQRHRLLEMHRRSRGLIDGQGAARIAGEIVEKCLGYPVRPISDILPLRHNNPKAA